MPRSKLVEVKCASVHDLQYEFNSIQQDLSLLETEESWDTIANAVSRIKSLANNGAGNYPSQLVASIRTVARPLINSLNSERSRLSGVALELFSTLGEVLESSFEPLVPIFLPALLALCARTNKVFCLRAKACIMAIIEHTRSSAIFPYLVDSLKDKSTSLRLVAAEAFLACLNTFDPPNLTRESRALEIEAVIKCTIRDASADIRKVSRKIFDAYNILVPDRVDAFVDPLTPTAKKYLNVKQKVTGGSGKTSHSSTSSQQLKRSLAPSRSNSSVPSLPAPEKRPPSNPTLTTMVPNHVSSGSVGPTPVAPPTIISRQPIPSAPRAGPVRCAVVTTRQNVGPVRLVKRLESSGVKDGPVRMLDTITGQRLPKDGPRRVTIVPIPPPPPSSKLIEMRKPVISTKPSAASSNQGPAIPSTSRPATTATKPGPPKIAPKSTVDEQIAKSVMARPAVKSSTSRTMTKVASSKGPSEKAGAKEKIKEKIKLVDDAALPLLPSAVSNAQNTDLSSSESKGVAEESPKQIKDLKVEQTPISALLTSIERGFKFPDFPPLPALAMVCEESFDISTICEPVVRPDVEALNIRCKSESNREEETRRAILIDMRMNN